MSELRTRRCCTSPETFVSMLVLDGVLERHPRLKGCRRVRGRLGSRIDPKT